MVLDAVIQSENQVFKRTDANGVERSAALERIVSAICKVLDSEFVSEYDLKTIKNLEQNVALNPNEYLRVRVSAVKFLIEKITEDDVITEYEMQLFNELTDNLSLDSESSAQIKNDIERIQNMYLIGRSDNATADASEPQHVQWWKSLDKSWKQLFHRYLGIEGIPTANNIENIFYLAQLDCSFNKITTLAPIQSLPNLSILKLSGCDQLTDWEILGNFTDLKNLSVKYNETLREAHWFKNMRRLFALDLSETSISSLQDVAELHNLEQISFGQTPITDLSPLQNLNKLHSIFCSHTLIKSLEPLKNLTGLKHLHILGCKELSEAAIIDFQKAQPNCLIRNAF